MTNSPFNSYVLQVIRCLLEDELFASPIPTLSSLSRRSNLDLSRAKIRSIIDELLGSGIVTGAHRDGRGIGPIPSVQSGMIYHVELLDSIDGLCNESNDELLVKRIRDLVILMREYISSSTRTFWFTGSLYELALDQDLDSIVARH